MQFYKNSFMMPQQQDHRKAMISQVYQYKDCYNCEHAPHYYCYLKVHFLHYVNRGVQILINVNKQKIPVK